VKVTTRALNIIGPSMRLIVGVKYKLNVPYLLRFWNICICYWKCLVFRPYPNRKFIYATYIPYEYSFEVILNTIFSNCVNETKSHGIEFSNYGFGIQIVLDLENFRFCFLV
jgi:hypothetical protein